MSPLGTTTSVIRFLHDLHREAIPAPPELHGFGGLHGGLLLGRAARAAQDAAPGRTVTAMTGHFHRSVRNLFDLTTRVVRKSAVTTVSVEATSRQGTHLTATAVLSTRGHRTSGAPAWSPLIPSGVRAPEDWEPFEVPAEFVPVVSANEIRPVGPNRPYAGGSIPELTAWVRIRDDDGPLDLPRFLFLIDALAPSLAAVLTDPVPIPTVELAARPGPAIGSTGSPWVLLHARTEESAADGWHYERIDAWTVEGQHLGSARQLRIARLPVRAKEHP